MSHRRRVALLVEFLRVATLAEKSFRNRNRHALIMHCSECIAARGRRVIVFAVVLLLHAMVFALARLSAVAIEHSDRVMVRLVDARRQPEELPKPPSALLPDAVFSMLPVADTPRLELQVEAVTTVAVAQTAPPMTDEMKTVSPAAAPVSDSLELAVFCPERTAPSYPPQARRLREQGTVALRVELDDQGDIKKIHVARSSGSTRLDEAGINAVRTWRCRPAMRAGRAVHSVALQEFEFLPSRR